MWNQRYYPSEFLQLVIFATITYLKEEFSFMASFFPPFSIQSQCKPTVFNTVQCTSIRCGVFFRYIYFLVSEKVGLGHLYFLKSVTDDCAISSILRTAIRLLMFLLKGYKHVCVYTIAIWVAMSLKENISTQRYECITHPSSTCFCYTCSL